MKFKIYHITPSSPSTYIQQDLQAFIMSIIRCLVNRSIPMLIWGGGGPSVLEQGVQHVTMTTRGSKVDRGTAMLVSESRISMSSQ